MLRAWRIAKGLTLTDGARFLGLRSVGALSDIERGKAFPSPETIALIEGATQGAVTADDHMKAWRNGDPVRFSRLRAAGRAAARAFGKPSKSKEQ